MASKISAKDVLDFFKEAEVDIVELIHEIGGATLKVRQTTKAKLVAGMAKARAARKPKGTAASADTSAGGVVGATSEVPQTMAAAAGGDVVRRGPGRPPRSAQSVPSVPAPPQTAEATSVESDEVIG